MKILPNTYHPLIELQDWDILIILDACRFDYFQKINWYKGQLHKRISFSSCTPEWYQSFKGIDMSNIVYVSGNPYIVSFEEGKLELGEKFRMIYDSWKTEWDEELQTVSPEKMTKKALEIWEGYKDYKIVLHYMQPHQPYIGEKRIESQGWGGARAGLLGEENGGDGKSNPMYRLVIGGKKLKNIIDAYESNLKRVLESLEPVLKLPGKKVITADHGEAFGEGGNYGHVEKSVHPVLVEVPWFEVE